MKDTLTPKAIVAALDEHIVGQKEAKRAVAVALRNRWRRQRLPEALRDEVTPKNILMIGPTGVGKTEISRRLARLANAPFIKVEATKFTEVGYVGRDVEQIVRDLADAAMIDTRERMRDEVKAKAHALAEERVVEALAGESARDGTRQMFRDKLKRGELDDTMIELELQDNSNPLGGMEMPGQPGQSLGGMMDLSGLMKAFGGRRVRRRVTVAESYELLIAEEADKLLDDDVVKAAALESVQENGIVFIDEIDKVCARADARGLAHMVAARRHRRAVCGPVDIGHGQRRARHIADQDRRGQIGDAGQHRTGRIGPARRYGRVQSRGEYAGVEFAAGVAHVLQHRRARFGRLEGEQDAPRVGAVKRPAIAHAHGKARKTGRLDRDNDHHFRARCDAQMTTLPGLAGQFLHHRQGGGGKIPNRRLAHAQCEEAIGEAIAVLGARDIAMFLQHLEHAENLADRSTQGCRNVGHDERLAGGGEQFDDLQPLLQGRRLIARLFGHPSPPCVARCIAACRDHLDVIQI